ncbi:recombinase family protein [Paracoccus yeei]|uniref:Recombinase family protein n=1 Tax=Paracoccus yeei TaxID=147645 RepID=A0A5P2QYI4_9RHOB|nr:recombinase family protein [Paracoccus yeei]QEU10406.1 recombinase family protein [Paracoccus yeei]
MTKQKLRVAIYARFSTDKQRDASIEDQIDSCRYLAAREGWQVTGTYHDRATSGASMFRPGIEALQREARAGKFDIVLAEAMDRLSRKLADIAKFHERMEHLGIRIHTLTEGEITEMLIGMKGTMNQILLRDIGIKTHRGQKGRVRAGKLAGGNAYGYDVLPGVTVNGKSEHGDRAINRTEAEVVRRIFRDYAQGTSAGKIAEALNIERIPGPRGGWWGTSTILGNRERGTGILNNELYVGRLVWNRLHFSKDPDTGKRNSRLNPEDRVTAVDVPHLRIIDDALWDQVKARQGAMKTKNTEVPIWDRRRPKFLFSGLMTCGCCSGGFSKVSKDGFGCSTARKKGAAACTNMAVIKQGDLERRVLHALDHHLMDEEAVRIFCEEYAAERNRLQATREAGRIELERELKQISTDHKKLVDAIIAGVPADQVKDRMIELDSRRKDLERKLSASRAPDPIRIHPGMARTYRTRIGQLIAGLAEAERMDQAKEALRALIEKVELVPVPAEESETGKPGLVIHLHGALASLLRLACGLPVHEVVEAAEQTQKAPPKAGHGGSNSADLNGPCRQHIDIAEELVLVAGAGFEPAAFRL